MLALLLTAVLAVSMSAPTPAQEQPRAARPLNGPYTWSTLSNAAHKAWRQKNWAEAERLFLLAVQEAEREGPSSPHLLVSMQGLGMLYSQQKKYAEAEQTFERAVTLAEEIFGPDDPRMWESLAGLMHVYVAQKKWPEAEALYRRGIAIFERHPESDKVFVPTLLEGLAMVLKAQGRYEEAEATLRRAGELPAAPHGQNVLRARELIRVAQVQRSRREKEKAEESIHLALELLQYADPTDLMVHNCLQEIGRYYTSAGRDSEARAIYLRLLEMQEASSGWARRGRTYTMQMLVGLYFKENRLDEAERMLDRAMESAPELGESYRLVLPGLVTWRAEIAAARGRYAEAEEILRKEAEREEAEGKSESPGFPFAWLGLARLYTNIGRFAEAEALFQRIIAEQEENLGPDDERLLGPLAQYARFLRKMERIAEAQAVEQRIKRIRLRPSS